MVEHILRTYLKINMRGDDLSNHMKIVTLRMESQRVNSNAHLAFAIVNGATSVNLV